MKDVFSDMFHSLRNKSSIRHQAQDFDQVPMVNSYYDEETKFVLHIKTILRSGVPKLLNIIGSHRI